MIEAISTEAFIPLSMLQRSRKGASGPHGWCDRKGRLGKDSRKAGCCFDLQTHSFKDVSKFRYRLKSAGAYSYMGKAPDS